MIPVLIPQKSSLPSPVFILLLSLGVVLALVGCSSAPATTPTAAPLPTAANAIPSYSFATLDTIAALSRLDPIPELRIYLQEPDIGAIETQVRTLFSTKGYTVTKEERSGSILILQFEGGGSVYSARIAPLPDASGQSLQILPAPADVAFNDASLNEGVPASFWQLTLGNCVLANDATQALENIPCEEPHFGEVVGAWNLPPDNVPFPEDAVWMNIYTYECAVAFKNYTGADPVGEHNYWYSGFGPTAASWAVGDRAVLCILFDANGAPLTGSALNEFQ